MAPRRKASTTVTARKAATPTKGTNGGKRRSTVPEPANGRAATTEETRPVLNAKTGTTRLGKGGLEALVSGHLKAHPKGEFSPSELANVLSRSSGAIANALEKLVRSGTATRTSDKPRRYRHRASTPGGKASAKTR